MKKWLVLVIIAAVIVTVSGIGVGEEEKVADKPVIQKRARGASDSQAEMLRKQVREGRGRQPTSPEDRMKRFQEQQAKQLERIQKGPTETISELNAIKKFAEKEKATETVAALDKLIAKTQKKMDQRVKTIKDKQARLQERMKKRGKRGPRPERLDAQPRKRPGRGGKKPAKPAEEAPEPPKEEPKD